MQNMQKIFGALLIVIMLALLIMLTFQETYKDILIPLGLYHPERGIFTDCSLPENRNNKYCESPPPPAAKQWKDIKEGPGFKIADDDI